MSSRSVASAGGRRLPSRTTSRDASARALRDTFAPAPRDTSRRTSSDACATSTDDGSELGEASHLEARRLPGRRCRWCEGPIPPRARIDSRYCGQRCRQASHRFGASCVARRRAATPLRLAYFDPPYPGLARRYYENHPDYRGEVDHAELLEVARPFDGWALSTSSRALPRLLVLCERAGLLDAVRVASWHRGARPHQSAAGPLCGWEPVIYCGGRLAPAGVAGATHRRVDALDHHARARTTDPRRVIGAKPSAFAFWIFDLLGALPGDVFVDAFPGSGGIARAWSRYEAAAR